MGFAVGWVASRRMFALGRASFVWFAQIGYKIIFGPKRKSNAVLRWYPPCLRCNADDAEIFLNAYSPVTEGTS